jgi:hypothetical protein
MSPEKYVADYVEENASEFTGHVVIQVVLCRVDDPADTFRGSVDYQGEGQYNLCSHDYHLDLKEIREQNVEDVVRNALENFKEKGSGWYVRGWDRLYGQGKAKLLTFFTETTTVRVSPPLTLTPTFDIVQDTDFDEQCA